MAFLLTYVVPFCVSVYSVLAMSRERAAIEHNRSSSR
jgi:hypothetical protein